MHVWCSADNEKTRPCQRRRRLRIHICMEGVHFTPPQQIQPSAEWLSSVASHRGLGFADLSGLSTCADFVFLASTNNRRPSRPLHFHTPTMADMPQGCKICRVFFGALIHCCQLMCDCYFLCSFPWRWQKKSPKLAEKDVSALYFPIDGERETLTHTRWKKKSSVICVGAEKWPDNLKSFLCCILWQCVIAGTTLDVLISDGDLGLFMPSTFALASNSDGSAESSSTLLLAGEQDCGEGGEAEECFWWSAFYSSKRDILRKVDAHVWMRACIHQGVICAQHGWRGHYCGISYKININLSFLHF